LIRELYENFTTAKKFQYGICVGYKKYLGKEMDLMRMQIFKTKFQKKRIICINSAPWGILKHNWYNF
jgi:hypothetical protein